MTGAPEGIFENVQNVYAALIAMLDDNITLRTLIIEGKESGCHVLMDYSFQQLSRIGVSCRDLKEAEKVREAFSLPSSLSFSRFKLSSAILS